MNQIEYLIFEGGGIKGLSYAGALEILEKNKLLNIKGVAGTSAGAITSYLLAIGYNSNEIIQILKQTNLSDFLENSDGVIRDVFRFINKYGWNTTLKLKTWLSNLLENKTNFKTITFDELYRFNNIHLKIYGTNLTKMQSECFDYLTNPKMNVIDAVVISMSIPFIYESVTYNDFIYCDGGVLNNYPVNAFIDHKDNCIGFRVDSDKEIQKTNNSISNIINYTESVVTTMLNNLNIDKNDDIRTIRINTKQISAINFNLTTIEKEFLIDAGKLATLEFLQ